MLGGPGDDTFIWNPGDGSDIIEGQGGVDTMVFNGANVGETIDLSANGQRLRFFRNVANITMDCNGVEVVKFNALGASDTITINDLTGTDVKNVNLDLASPPASGQGDNAADSVIINATGGDDNVTVIGAPGAGVSVQGLAATVSIVGTDPALDNLFINLLGGNDVLQAADLQAGVINLTADGGPGDDVLVGSHGDDTLFGGEGDDILEGGPGQDVLDGGPGNNVIIQD
jgi:Ca2+-binding RTX toxin-like protein